MPPASDNNPQTGAGRSLPKKENDAFRNVIKLYESKQYKKAVKYADGILKKFPNHGETLAMKGLTVYYMGRKDESHELVKKGLMFDMRSHVCWHVFGLLHRADRNYNEAIKAYKQALKFDPNNFQILRDLSLLQVQMRDLDGFAVTRNSILSLRPNMKTNWLAFALARHLTGDLDGAKAVIDTFLGTLQETDKEFQKGFESSELALYTNSLLSEIPDNYQRALDHLHSIEHIVVDKGYWMTKMAEYQLMLGDYKLAKQTALSLFERGQTENYYTHTLFMSAILELEPALIREAMQLKGARTLPHLLPLSQSQITTVKQSYKDELQPLYPKSFAIKRIPGFLLQGEELKTELRQICHSGIAKGIPSLCQELLSYVLILKDGRYCLPADRLDYVNHETFKMLTNIADEAISNLDTMSKFNAEDEDAQPPSSNLWAMYLRASLHEVEGKYIAGIDLVDRCIEHTPTIVDLYELKALLLAGAGSAEKAAECADHGRSLDGQDRYINNLTTRYMLRAGKDQTALDRIGMFTKHEGNPEKNLFDMQCSWYELEVAALLAERKQWGRSLKKYVSVARHFDDFNEDQFDFHNYCWRKGTLRAYISVIRYEDEIYGQEYFCRAAAGIIRIYLHIFDNPGCNDTAEPDYSKMSAAEKKKAKAIARKKKKQTEKESDAQETASGNKEANGNPSFLDGDPEGVELLKNDPLEESKKFSDMMVKYAPKNTESWILRYDVSVRRKKPLMALQALFQLKKLEPKNHMLLSRLVDFVEKVDSWSDASDVVSTILKEDTPLLVNSEPVPSFIQRIAKEIATESPLPYRVAIASALVKTKSGSATEAAALILEGLEARAVSVETCKGALETLKSFGSSVEDQLSSFKSRVKELFPLSSIE